MKKKLVFSAMLLCVMALGIVLSGCVSNMPPKKNLFWHGHVMEPEYHDYTVLGPVRLDKNWMGILGISMNMGPYVGRRDFFLYQKGGVNYVDVLDAAKKAYPDTDAVIDLTYDYKDSAYFVFFSSRTEILTGIAIKYAKEQKNAGRSTAIVK